MILPTRELVAFPRCSVCEQLNAAERSSAQWPLSVPALLDDSRWQRDQCLGTGFQAGQTDSTSARSQISGTGDYCPRVPGPVPQAVVPFRPRLLLRELILAHSPSDLCRSIRGSPHHIRLALFQEGVAHTECATITFQATVHN